MKLDEFRAALREPPPQPLAVSLDAVLAAGRRCARPRDGSDHADHVADATPDLGTGVAPLHRGEVGRSPARCGDPHRGAGARR
jgi:hypothetical protein